jgi:hypothetical protein
MARNVGRLRFAGDATDDLVPTLVFGAYRSGFREGLAVAKLLAFG